MIRSAVRALPRYSFTPHTGEGLIKLDQNEGPLDLPEELRARALERLAREAWNRYPELHPAAVERALAADKGWDADGVVVTNGSNVLLQALAIVAGIGRSVVTVTPTFSVYGLQARLLGAELIEVPLAEGFELPTDALLEAMRGRSGVVFLADPAAPTGNALDRDRLVRVSESAGDDWLIVLDEAYGDFAGSDHADLVAAHANAVSVRTFSKAVSLAGARIGYGLMAPALASEVRKALLPFSFSALQAAVALSVLEEPGYVEARVARARHERDRLADRLRALQGVTVYPSVTNFVLFRVPDAAAVFEGLLARGVVVRRQDHLPGLDGCLRVTAGLPHENAMFLDALEAALADSDSGPGGGSRPATELARG